MTEFLALNIIERLGAYVGFFAFLGLAILALLYFSQARDVRRLREWAGRAPERAAEAEGRSAQQSPTVVRKPAPAQSPAAQSPAGQAAAAGTQAGGGPSTGNVGAVTPAGQQPGAAPATVSAAQTAAGQAAAQTAAAKANGEDVVDQPTFAEPEATEDTGERDQALVDQPTVAHTPVEDVPALDDEPLDFDDEPLPRSDYYLPGTTLREADERRRPKPLGQRIRAMHIPEARYVLATIAIVVFLVLAVGSVAGIIDIGGGGGSSKTEQSKKSAGSKTAGGGAAGNVDPASVTVAVLNGTTVTGLAYKVSQEAKSNNFNLGNVTNAATNDQQKSEVLYAAGQKSAARAVADRLGIATIAPVDSVNATIAGSADAVVLVGADRSG